MNTSYRLGFLVGTAVRQGIRAIRTARSRQNPQTPRTYPSRSTDWEALEAPAFLRRGADQAGLDLATWYERNTRPVSTKPVPAVIDDDGQLDGTAWRALCEAVVAVQGNTRFISAKRSSLDELI